MKHRFLRETRKVSIRGGDTALTQVNFEEMSQIDPNLVKMEIIIRPSKFLARFYWTDKVMMTSHQHMGAMNKIDVKYRA